MKITSGSSLLSGPNIGPNIQEVESDAFASDSNSLFQEEQDIPEIGDIWFVMDFCSLTIWQEAQPAKYN